MITFRTIKWKNFLSTGNMFTEMNLVKDTATLVVGSNGSGKSTMLDAICFALFGKPFRNINKPQLLNSINLKDCVVEVEFDMGNKSYKVVRGLKPNLFEIHCDGALLSQTAASRDYQEHLEKFILKLNYKSFTQIVILGSASFVPFMQLSANDRRLIIEDLLDIQIFSRMNNVLKEKSARLKDEIILIKNKAELANEKHAIQTSHMQRMRRGKTDKVSQKQQLIRDETAQIAQYEEEYQKLALAISELSEKIKSQPNLQKKIQKLDLIEKNLQKTISKVNEDIQFYESSDSCPTCKQGIPHEHKSLLINERRAKLSDIQTAISDLNEKYNQHVDELNGVNRLLVEMNQKTTTQANVSKNLAASYKYVNSLKEDLNSIIADETDIGQIQQNIDDLLFEIQECDLTHKTLLTDKQYLDVASNLLKDTGIKTKIIRQYIPVINKLVNKYLSAMDFFVNFTLDESFKETIKSRHRDDFSYESFSEGEKQRIDMALMLTWRSIAKLKNSSNTNLLILDEVFDSSLDTNGTEDLMKILNLLESTNLFVISHKGDVLQDKFRDVIRFEKVNNFSRMIK